MPNDVFNEPKDQPNPDKLTPREIADLWEATAGAKDELTSKTQHVGNEQPSMAQSSPDTSSRLTPSEIAELWEATAAIKAQLKGEMKHVGDEQSGQLSPSHTPGRGR